MVKCREYSTLGLKGLWASLAQWASLQGWEKRNNEIINNLCVVKLKLHSYIEFLAVILGRILGEVHSSPTHLLPVNVRKICLEQIYMTWIFINYCISFIDTIEKKTLFEKYLKFLLRRNLFKDVERIKEYEINLLHREPHSIFMNKQWEKLDI